MEHEPSKWPDGYVSCFCLRVDIDTIKDAKACSQLISLLRDNEVRATFFVATGPDDSGRNLMNAIKGMGGVRYVTRYGFDGLRGLLLPALDVERQLRAWGEIVDQGHEIALHGYWHRRWACEASGWKLEDTRRAVKEGVRRFTESFSFRPKGFAAPSFRTNESLAKVLDEMEFTYSSNTRIERSFNPRKASGGSVFEIPVTFENFEEMVLGGLGEEQAFNIVQRNLDISIVEENLFCYYIHPYFELSQHRIVLRKLLLHARGQKIWKPTMSEVVNWLRKSG
ncbi:MAG: DUF2334 domain-containing protein [Thermoproteota archaeon]